MIARVRPTGAADPARLAVAFVRVLRGGGTSPGPDATVRYAEALAAVGVEHPAGVYWAGRATLVHHAEDVPAYDRAFAAFWGALAAPRAAGAEPERRSSTLATDDPDAGEPEAEATAPDEKPAEDVLAMRWSATEALRSKDFADYSDAELAEARRLMTELRFAGARRRSRRRRPAPVHRRRGPIDTRRTVRRALATAGEPARLLRTEPSDRPRRLVLLVDVSGSMEPYARALLRFVQAAVAGGTKVEAFTLGTRLTRVTRELTSHDPDAALAAATAAVVDWSGGTRLGVTLREFNDRWGVRGFGRGATVIVLSDGWDRGDPQLLGAEVARLHRVTHRLVWVNPLKATPGYAPLAAGMAAALPHVDEFVEGHSLESLEQLVKVVGR
jgi:uncharacterized protein with von Willebrand factor type A (vWA) domain